LRQEIAPDDELAYLGMQLGDLGLAIALEIAGLVPDDLGQPLDRLPAP